jgi:hypothetical protein
MNNIRQLALSALLITISVVSAETVELRTGEVLIGQVLDVEGDALKMEVVYPDVGAIRELQTSDLTPDSLYVVLALRTAPDDAKARLALARRCEEIGLPAHAIAEYRRAGRLDPGLEEDCAKQVKAIIDEVARRLLQEARENLAAEELSAVELALQLVVGRFPDSEVAGESRALLKQVQAKRQGGGGPARKLRPDILQAALNDAKLNVDRAQKEIEEAAAKVEQFTNSVLTRRQLQSIVHHLERAYKLVERVEPPSSHPVLAQDLVTTRDHIGADLLEFQLLLCSAWIHARAIPSAKRSLERAFELAPDDPRCAKLHDLIHDSRLVRDWGRRIR